MVHVTFTCNYITVTSMSTCTANIVVYTCIYNCICTCICYMYMYILLLYIYSVCTTCTWMYSVCNMYCMYIYMYALQM